MLAEQVTERALELFRLWGFRRIDTPVFEHTELFERGLAPGSDVVTKQMFTFEDKGGRSLTLRPDMTAPVVRAILEHSLDREGLPVKVYYAASIFRHERPQAGRYRQFNQVGIEAVGSPGPGIDAEVILLAREVLMRAGLEGVELLLNTIGDDNCRPVYMPKLTEFLRSHEDELCGDCRRKIESNPLRTFDCKVEHDREVLRAAPVITEYLCADCKEHYELLKELLGEAGAQFTEDPRLVRGLDYYTRTAFEFVSGSLGAQNAVGAGGRYDGLAEQLGGPALPGIGFGLGVERIVLALEEQGQQIAAGPDVYVISVDEASRSAARQLAGHLRAEGVSCDLDTDARHLKGQFKAADRSGARYSVIIGPQELESGAYKLKDMRSGKESSLAFADLLTEITAESRLLSFKG